MGAFKKAVSMKYNKNFGGLKAFIPVIVNLKKPLDIKLLLDEQ